jgi:hypothetical protein
LTSVKRTDPIRGKVNNKKNENESGSGGEGIRMGQSSPRWPMTGQVWHRAELLERMIARLDVCGAAARLDDGTGLLEARGRCLDCISTGACERFLAEEPLTEEPPGFCLNVAFLLRCLEAKRQRTARARGRPAGTSQLGR